MKKVIKRDGSYVEFDKTKISNAILKAMKNGVGTTNYQVAYDIANEIEQEFKNQNKDLSIYSIEEHVFDSLVEKGQILTARAYEGYRSIREFQRKNSNTTDQEVKELLSGTSEYWNEENSNKNQRLLSTQRDYMAGILSTDLTKRFLLSPDIVQAHDEGILHFHDMDYFAENAITNCCLINLEDMLQNGTCINNVRIEKPHRLLTAMTIASQIVTAVTSSQYGGATISLTHLAPFVRDSYNKYLDKYKEYGLDLNSCIECATKDLKKEINDAVQTFNYQVNSMMTTNGQSPFLSVSMHLGETDEYKEELAMLIEEFFNQRIVGLKNEVGAYVTQAFPKLLYVLEEDNIHENSKYWYLTELAAKCTAKRMVPDYISEKIMKELKGDVYPCMGCRSFLTPDRFTDSVGNISNAWNYEPKQHKYYGRFNQGVVTINLVDIAFSSKGDLIAFWNIFEERMELCHKALRIRHDRLKNTTSDVAPILWQDGAFARLRKGESIDKLLYGGYSTISLGYAGLYECCMCMINSPHIDEGEGEKFGLQVMQAINNKCNQWKEAENIDYSPYGSPIESATYKFATCLKKRFGEDIFKNLLGKDQNYITNSYHAHVTEEIDPFEKLRLESKFQKLSGGGAISYVETSNLTHNTEAVLEVIKFIYDNIMYAELNTKSDYCQVCGYDGEIQLLDKDNKLIWHCPNCGNEDTNKMNVARRTCGYIGTNFWNKGRTDEIHNRYVHLDDHWD